MSVESETPQRLLNAAVAFFQAASRCEFTIHITPLQSHGVGAPTVVNYALSIELYFKLVGFLTNGKAPWGHELLDLYDGLTPEIQATLVEHTRFSFGSSVRLREGIAALSKAFVQWRYAHEHEMLVVINDHLEELARGLHLTVREIRPDLISCYGE